MNKYYLNFIDEGAYKDVYSISLNIGQLELLDTDKQKILNLLKINGVSQEDFESNIDNFVYVEAKKQSNDFYKEFDTQKLFEEISVKVYYDYNINFVIMDKCNLDLINKSNPLSLLNSNITIINNFTDKLEEKVNYFLERNYVYLDLKFSNMCTNTQNFNENTELYIIDFGKEFCYDYNNTLINVDKLINIKDFFKLTMLFIFCSKTIDDLPKTNILYKHLQQYLIDKFNKSNYDLFTFLKDLHLLQSNNSEIFTPKEYLFYIFFEDVILTGIEQDYESTDDYTIIKLVDNINRNIFKKVDISKHDVLSVKPRSISVSNVSVKPKSISKSKKSKSKKKSKFRLFSRKVGKKYRKTKRKKPRNVRTKKVKQIKNKKKTKKKNKKNINK